MLCKCLFNVWAMQIMLEVAAWWDAGEAHSLSVVGGWVCLWWWWNKKKNEFDFFPCRTLWWIECWLRLWLMLADLPVMQIFPASDQRIIILSYHKICWANLCLSTRAQMWPKLYLSKAKKMRTSGIAPCAMTRNWYSRRKALVKM